MTGAVELPYGAWPSPISADELAASSHPVAGAVWVGTAGDRRPWWGELRPAEGGRTAVRTIGDDGEPVDVLPAPFNARSRVHEYGGGAWTAVDAGTSQPRLAFVEFGDQRVFLLAPGGEPIALTPAGLGMRFGELAAHPSEPELIALREWHVDGGVRRDIVAIPLDGTAATDADRIRSIVAGSHFLGYSRISPTGDRLAWIAWEHPLMPWDGTELRVGALERGRVASWEVVAGSIDPAAGLVSVVQPEWTGVDELTFSDDRTGWWNLHRISGVSAPDAAARAVNLLPEEAELGGPLWNVGTRWFAPLADGSILVNRSVAGADTLGILRVPADGTAASVVDLGAPLVRRLVLGSVADGRMLVTGTGTTLPNGCWAIDLGPDHGGRELGDMTLVRSGVDDAPDPAYLPTAQPMTFAGPRGPVHAYVYPPTNPDTVAPAGELPPYVAMVHGGPTANVSGSYDVEYAFFTSRGIGVIDVNYGGSTGYGRAYRERLNGEWGVVDVEDTVAAVTGLADAGLADRDRLAIMGGSAGGWTVLAALTRTDVFACGVDLFGVAELEDFVSDTHDFESRYTDSLVGPWPEAIELYRERAPLNHVDGLSCPVLILQGLDDPIVPPSQSEVFRDAMVAKGILHAYVTYEGESHGFRKASTIIDAAQKELSFFGQVLGFEPVDVPRVALTRG